MPHNQKKAEMIAAKNVLKAERALALAKAWQIYITESPTLSEGGRIAKYASLCREAEARFKMDMEALNRS